MDRENLLRTICKIALTLVIGSILVTFLKIAITNYNGQRSISSGPVTNKQVIYKNATYFRDSVEEYVLFVEGEYTNAFDKPVKFEKAFYVNEAAYKHYNIGDYFDSSKLIETKSASQEE